MVKRAADELWHVAVDAPYVDAAELAGAIEAAVADADADVMDYRTRLLVRDALDALEAHWGAPRFVRWRDRSAARDALTRAKVFDHSDNNREEIGFPSLSSRITDAITPEGVREFFRALALHTPQRTRLNVGGSLALMLCGLLSRHTEDVDIADEVPATLRSQHEVLDELAARFGLQLALFQSHYLPEGWDRRLRAYEVFGKLEVYLVDPYDVAVGKLFSRRAKDLDDLRAMKPKLEYAQLKSRLIESGARLLSEDGLRNAAAENWYVLFGEELPA